MKKISTLFLALLFIIAASAQKRPSDKLFEKMSLQNGVTILSFSKEMLDAVNMNFGNESSNEEKQVTGDLHEVKVLIYKAPDNEEPLDFRNKTLHLLPRGKFKKIDADEYDIDNNDGTVDIRVHSSGRRVKECHIVFQGETNGVLLSFFGNFKVDDVEDLAEKINDYK